MCMRSIIIMSFIISALVLFDTIIFIACLKMEEKYSKPNDKEEIDGRGG